MTSRGLKEADFEKVGDFLEQAVNISLEVQKESGKMLKDFLKGLEGNAALAKLRGRRGLCVLLRHAGVRCQGAGVGRRG